MKNRKYFSMAAIFAVLLMSTTLMAQKLKPEEIVAKHLDSIAPMDKRAATKTLVGTGEVQVEYVSQKNQPAKGRVVIASEGSKLFFGMLLNAADYERERIVFDGKKVLIDFIRPGVRSDLGNFVQNNSELASHGLIGGTLSTSWALLIGDPSKGKVSSGGTKKIDGREVYALNYMPKGGNDVDIIMYFDKETFRHVRTEYKRLMSSGIGRDINSSARTQEIRTKLTEDFSDYKDFQGRVVPYKYKMVFEFSGTNSTKEISWTFEMMDFVINQSLEASTFALSN